MTFSTVMSNANLLRMRRTKKRKENKFSPLMTNYSKHFLDCPWRVTPDIVKIYCGPSRRWRHVSSSVCIWHLSYWNALLHPPAAKACCLPWHPLTGPARASSTMALAATQRRRALCLPFMFHPSSRGPERERQGNLLLTSLGPSPFTKKLNGTYGATSHSFPSSAQHRLQDQDQKAQVICGTSDQVQRVLS